MKTVYWQATKEVKFYEASEFATTAAQIAIYFYLQLCKQGRRGARSRAQMIEELRLSERTLDRALKELAAVGLIAQGKQKRSPLGSRRANVAKGAHSPGVPPTMGQSETASR